MSSPTCMRKVEQNNFSSFDFTRLSMDLLGSLSIFACVLLHILQPSIAADYLRESQFIKDDGTKLVSKGGTFELGFFTPGTSNKRYLGIWHKNIPVQTVVWVANRINPINDSTVTLTMATSGNLVLSQNSTILWSTNSTAQAQSPTARLLDSGNLVVIDENAGKPEAYLWQSFDHPSDTLLPGMKYGWDLRNGWEWSLTAWRSPDDPSPGDFTNIVMLHSYPDSYIMKGTNKFYRFGPWNGLQGSGSPEVKTNPVFEYTFVDDGDEYYYMFNLKNSSVLTRLVLNQTDSARYRYVWLENEKKWTVYSKKPVDFCDTYGLCGANGNCIITESPVCHCLKGFKPKSPQHWNSSDWSGGCVRNKPLNCSEKHKHGFVKFTGLKAPDTTQTWLDVTMNLEQCRQKCLENCSCTAFANSDIRGTGSGCALWFGELTDIRYYASGGQDLYIRMDASELESGNKKKLIMIVIIATGATFGMLLVGGYIIYRVRRNRTEKLKNVEVQIQNDDANDADLPIFDLPTIARATDNFSEKNKIGQGGFGHVYWGKLSNGREIAVKRLSTKSRQGLTEFKTEVKFIVKLQHRNLVKLIGCCIHGQEKMLVYEYMPNKSLNSFIFDETRGELLDWSKRFDIVMGIGRGLMYLHQDSRLRIIHRDLKASNILLDNKLVPKISDFGLAKTFEDEEMEGNTKRVVGTYGYMAPEYAADGLYSIKSDVFSYGILVLEIICGKKNRGFYFEESKHNLVGFAWMQWKKGRALELVDKNIKDELCSESEVLRCLHVSLLCVQHNAEDRPTIASAILMLESEIELPEPKQPGFFNGNDSFQPHSSDSNQKEHSSTNEMTVSLLEAR